MDRRLVLLSAIATIVAGLLLAAGTVLESTGGGEDVPLSEAATTNAYRDSTTMFFLYALMLTLALPGWYIVQAHKTKALGFAVHVLLSVGVFLVAGLIFTIAIVVPSLSSAAPEFLDDPGGPAGALGMMFMVGFSLFSLGILAFGALTVWAGVLPRIAGVLVALHALGEFAPDALRMAGDVASAAGLVWIGWTIWTLGARGRSAPTSDTGVAPS